MIRLLRGNIEATTDNSVTLLVGGVGYLVYTNSLRYAHEIGTDAVFHTHLAVRENALDLYGFPTMRELNFFELLLTIPKIGPKSALQILTQADPDLIATAVVLQNADHLHKVSGIGKKTASNIVTALAGKIDATNTDLTNTPTIAVQFSPAQADAVAALITLGYQEKEATERVLAQAEDLLAKDLIQAVLKSEKRF